MISRLLANLPHLLVLGFIILGVGYLLLQGEKPYQSYISQHQGIAVNQMKRTGVPASIQLAMGVINSNAGKNNITLQSNNHFMLKCMDGWSGKTLHLGSNDLGSGAKSNDCYRAYENAQQSYKDYVDYIKGNGKFAALFSLAPNDIGNWAKGIQSAFYPKNPGYVNQLMQVVQEYQLSALDAPKVASASTKEQNVSLSEKREIMPEEYDRIKYSKEQDIFYPDEIPDAYGKDYTSLSLREELSNYDSIKTALWNELDDYNTKRAQVNEKISRYDSLRMALKDEISKYGSKSSELWDKIAEFDSKKSSLRGELSDLDRKRIDLKKKIATYEDRRIETERKIKQYEYVSEDPRENYDSKRRPIYERDAASSRVSRYRASRSSRNSNATSSRRYDDAYEDSEVTTYDEPDTRSRYEDTRYNAPATSSRANDSWLDFGEKKDIPDDLGEINGAKMIMTYRGDTPDIIAERMGMPVSDILAYNEGLKSPRQQLKKGTVIYLEEKRKVYKGRERYHLVKPEETMFDIAQFYGIQLEALYERNKMPLGSEPAVGEEIRLKTKARKTPSLRSGAYADYEQETTAYNGSDNRNDNEYEPPSRIVINDVPPPDYQEVKPKPSHQPSNNMRPPPPIPLDESSSTSTSTAGNAVYHTVIASETLYSISKHYNTPIPEIMQMNGLSSNNIKRGMRLRVK